MLKNYLVLAWRNIRKDKLFSFINIVGLSVGVAVCLLIVLFVVNEWSFDKFHRGGDQIHRLWVKEHYKGDIFFNSVTPLIVGPELSENFPEIQLMTHYMESNYLVRKGNNLNQEAIQFADPDFFDIFSFQVLAGQKEDLLSDLSQIILSEKLALKYFDTRSPIGETLPIQIQNEWHEFEVVGVLENPPTNSSIQYQALLPYELYKTLVSAGGRTCWTCVYGETYVKLQENITGIEMQKKSASFIDSKVADIYEANEYQVGFQPIRDIHLNTEIPIGIAAVSDPRYPYILAAIALMILLLAGINYVSLAVGRSVNRAKEVGIRKTTGARKRDLIFQFWGESIMVALFAVSLGIVLAKIALPWFNEISNQQLNFPIDTSVILYAVLGSLLIGLLAGIYPALVLAAFNPLTTLRGSIGSFSLGRHAILKALVGIQFFASIALISVTMIMKKQMVYLQNKNLGFVKEGTVIVPYTFSGDFGEAIENSKQLTTRFRNEIDANSPVLNVTTSNHVFGSLGWSRLGYTDEMTQKFRYFFANGIDQFFIPNLEINLLAGDNFSGEEARDKNAVIINESFARVFDLNDPIGQGLPEPFQDFRVIGITEDFHFASLHQTIEPLVLTSDPLEFFNQAPDYVVFDPRPKFSFKVDGNRIQESLSAIEAMWKKHVVDQPFTYSFMEEQLNRQYQSEQRLSLIITYGTLLAIFIACMGLLGIVMLSTARRKKEIGIRKVLGASTISIITLLNKTYVKLILIAFTFAAPLAWWASHQWLEDFAFRTSLNAFTFIKAGVIILFIAIIIVSLQSGKVSLMNPVKSLRDE